MNENEIVGTGILYKCEKCQFEKGNVVWDGVIGHESFFECSSCGEKTALLISPPPPYVQENFSRWELFKSQWAEFFHAFKDYYFLQRIEYKEDAKEKKLGETLISEVKETRIWNPIKKQWVESVRGVAVMPFWAGALIVLTANFKQRKIKKYHYSLMNYADAMFMADVFGEKEPATKEDFR